MAKVETHQGEVIIQHPDHDGAIMRIAASSFKAGTHKLWDLDVEPWQDGTGEALPGAKARNAKKDKKDKGDEE